MNILLINHYAGSIHHGMEYRPYYLAREWVKMGHNVTIAAASFSHLRTQPPATRGSVTEETVDGICYVWFKTPSYTGNGFFRAINMFGFVGQLLYHYRWLSREAAPDAVIASSTYPFDIIPAYLIARKNRVKLIFEVHDLWPLSLIEVGGMSQYHPFIVLMQWAEDFAYRNADKVISMLPKTMEYMTRHGMAPEKFAYIPNGVDITEWQNESGEIPKEHKQVFSTLKAKGHFLVGYAGTHGFVNVLDHFIDAAYQLQDHLVTFVLIGHGQEKERLIKKAQSRKQTNVVFLPPVEKKSVPAILEEMDLLYIGLKGDPLFRFGVSPNKLMDYLMSAKPVIYAIQSGNDMVLESGCCISIPPENPDEIAKAVLHLMSLSAEDRKEMGKKGKEYVLANHDYKVLTRQFLAALDSIGLTQDRNVDE